MCLITKIESFSSHISETLNSSSEIITNKENLQTIHNTFINEINTKEEKDQADDIYADFKDPTSDPSKILNFNEYYKLLKTQVTSTPTPSNPHRLHQ